MDHIIEKKKLYRPPLFSVDAFNEWLMKRICISKVLDDLFYYEMLKDVNEGNYSVLNLSYCVNVHVPFCIMIRNNPD